MNIANLETYYGQDLGPDEFLLKIRPSSNTGFLTKLTQKGKIPLAFENWGHNKYPTHGLNDKPLQIYVFKEEFNKGWKIHQWRFGQSQNWATMIHPKGFTLEIYLTDLLNIIVNNTVIDGVIQGEFKWENNTLIKK